MAPTTTFVGGKLSFKGDKKSKKKKKSKKEKRRRREEEDEEEEHVREQEERAKKQRQKGDDSDGTDDEEDLTEAERRSRKFKLEKQKRDLEKVAELSHRDRVEEFNQNLAQLTEHNDIPRVSAAGNG